MRANEPLSVHSLAFTVESSVDASEGLGCCHSLFTVESTVEAYDSLSVYSLASTVESTVDAVTRPRVSEPWASLHHDFDDF